MITIIIGNTKCKLIGLTDSQVIKNLDQEMSYTIPGHQFVKSYNGWDGRQRLFTKSHCFPIGLLSRAEKILKSYGYSYELKDNRDNLVYGPEIMFNSNSGLKPRDYQIEVVNLAQKAGGGIVRMCTGSGKTLALSMLTAKFNVKTVIYVIGIELLYQMKDTLSKAYPQLKVGIVGDGNCDIQDVTITTIWSAASAFNKKADVLDTDLTLFKKKNVESESNKEKIRKMVKEAELFILDECQVAGSDTVKLLHQESISARHRFLFSGTPWREDGLDILIEAVGGPKFYNLDASTLIDRGILIPPRIYFMDVPNQRGIGSTYQEIYKKYIVENEDRNEIIVKAAIKLKESGRKILILINQTNHGKILKSLLEKNLCVDNLDGTNSSEVRLEAIKKMKSGKLDVLIASKIFDQGIDIPELDALILAGSGKSSGRALQRIGRVIRGFPGKKDAVVIDFQDNCKYLNHHSKLRKQIYETEPKFKVIMPKERK